MDPSALLLLSLSAATHALWNLMGKGRAPSLRFFAAAEGAMAVVGLASWPWSLPLLAPAPPAFWGLLAASCLCQAGYYAGVAAAYRRNDLSAAYPLVRAMPVVLLALATGLLGWRPLGAGGATGVALVAAGCLLVALPAWAGWRGILAGLAQPAILAAALCGALYTGIDASLSAMASAQSGRAGILALAAVMVVGNALACSLLAAVLPGERGRGGPLPAILPGAALAGLGIWLSYGSLLLALPLVGNPGWASAFRQLSIPLAVVLGVCVLHERPSVPRRVGVGVIAAGLAVLALTRPA